MKAKLVLLLLLLCCICPALAQQNPLVGTWEAVSIKGTTKDGTKIVADGSQFKEINIITPTHYMLVTELKQGDSYVFDKAIAGTVRVEGNKYMEIPMYFSREGTDKAKMDFTYQLQGDRFIKSGTITYPDGKVATLDELVFKKVKAETHPDNPAIGTWNQLSSRGVDANGKELWSHTNATHTRFQIISPTHLMRISLNNNQYENVMGGTYRMEGNKVYPNFEIGVPQALEDITQRIEGDKLYWTLVIHAPNGDIRVEDVFERVDGVATKTASTR